MKQQTTKAIVLARTDYGEADRIVTVLTPHAGKLRLMAKGVRRIKSKLAGGIELFSVSDLTYIQGRGEIGTLISSRLETHYGHIITDITRTMLGYELIKQLNKATEDEPEMDYFHLLQQAFTALDDISVGVELIRLWFSAQLLRLGGHTPNLTHDTDGARLLADQKYEFNFDDQAFIARTDGPFDADSIKFLRLLFSENMPVVLSKVNGSDVLVERISSLVNFMRQQYIH